MRKGLLLVTFALIAASCGGPGEPAAASTAAPVNVDSSSEAAATPSTVSTATTDTDPAATPITTAASPSFDGPPAPDFELVLADGSVFRLSDEQKPVYVVFWAEW
ncbi:MAG: hypothetical protein U9N84_02110 [Actinomycetota bacterium]|nr:hypothetical protein [Actinomycetota bacterium]